MRPEPGTDPASVRKAQLDRRLHDIAWGLLLLITGIVWLVPSSTSFRHAVLERFDAGLRDAGHVNELVDLHRLGRQV